MLLYQGGKKEQRIVSSQATFYRANFGKIEYLLAVAPIKLSSQWTRHNNELRSIENKLYTR